MKGIGKTISKMDKEWKAGKMEADMRVEADLKKFISQIKNNYSYLKAVIGSNLEARMAGATPKITPTNIENPKERATDHQVTVVVIN